MFLNSIHRLHFNLILSKIWEKHKGLELTLSCILERVHYSTHLYEIMSNMDDWEKAGKILLNGGIAVLPTDTIYGLHCLATNKGAVERIYDLKGRDRTKPFIILISSLDDLKNFGVTVDKKLTNLLANYWPGPNSIILPVTNERFEYLHRGTKSLAFRLPAYKPLLTLLTQTGPLVSTSANPSSKTPASDIKQAQAYLGKSVDFYLDAGVLNNLPSRVFKLDMNQLIPVR